jgi:hypothetical protein
LSVTCGRSHLQRLECWPILFIPLAAWGITNVVQCIVSPSATSDGGRRGRDRMIVGFTTIYAISAHHHWCCEVESQSGWGVQHYVIKFVSDLRQVSSFLRFLPPIKLTARITNAPILHGDTLYNKRTKYKKNFAELPFANVVFDRMVMIFYGICNFCFICYALGLLQYSKSVWSNCLHIHKLYFNASKLYQKREKLPNVSFEIMLIIIRKY